MLPKESDKASLVLEGGGKIRRKHFLWLLYGRATQLSSGKSEKQGEFLFNLGRRGVAEAVGTSDGTARQVREGGGRGFDAIFGQGQKKPQPVFGGNPTPARREGESLPKKAGSFRKKGAAMK